MFDALFQFDITQWVSTLGYAGLLLIVLLEMGVFFGFFLPGDSLVFAAGLLASKGIFNIWYLVPMLVLTAVLGYAMGYWFGDKLGHWLMRCKESIFFKRRYVESAHAFYEKHGGKALILGRLVPIVRTFVPIVAGMAQMSYRKYFIFNIAGALVWGAGVTLLGFWIGGILPEFGNYILPLVLLIILISILPGLWHIARRRCRRKA